MAVRIDAVALSSPVWCFSLVFVCLFVCLLVIVKISQANHSYSRLDILNIGFQCYQVVIHVVELHNIPEEIARTLHGLLSALASDDGGGYTGSKSVHASRAY